MQRMWGRVIWVTVDSSNSKQNTNISMKRKIVSKMSCLIFHLHENFRIIIAIAFWVEWSMQFRSVLESIYDTWVSSVWFSGCNTKHNAIASCVLHHTTPASALHHETQHYLMQQNINVGVFVYLVFNGTSTLDRSIYANCGRVKPTQLAKDGQRETMHNSWYGTQCNAVHNETLQLQKCN